MSEISNAAIQSVRQSRAAWCRFITGNDTGTTGSHQAGFYIPKCASALLFDEPGRKGENKEKTVQIKWQDDFTTESCMKYYGQRTRNEYRITRFGRNFPFLQDENVGDLLIIAKFTEEDYAGYVLSSDEDIDEFFAYFNLAPDETNQLIDIDGSVKPDEKIAQLLQSFVAQFNNFPETRQMAQGARDCYNNAYGIAENALRNKPDEVLLNWVDTEYRLFKCMEEKVYADVISKPFGSIEAFVQTANEVLNRRKSRAGKSLEHHLADIFTHNELVFEEQAITEDNKKPDFLFPNGECYHNMQFPADDLIVLGAKTTCKDRWRQVLTEADRVDVKYLFTLQQGISKNQLKEMHDSRLTLVVPHKYIASFPQEYQSEISDLKRFISLVRQKQEHLPKHYILF
ncbi:MULTISPECIES: type II restriction endonuclease [unclassified Prevotella]|uniref:type II restriction endonuclease n=1 Tax=unclassified Prevotella TaxID=2638335 RepID=UPI000B95D43D|nr:MULTISPECIES: type II restriction endonuclease [unclassified Prevotella]MCI7274214.1 type II restriction endonuclease [bacterium]OYP41268.1 restriction endonuclease [Prevotella sp. P5-50]OYP43701.1 restriction endonuclease [Prevotella sp. P4-119]OYP48368.1 restriction endonuclease [Prevotella sp. P4-98]